MGLMQTIFGGSFVRDLGTGIKETSEVFHVNETAKMHADANRFQSVLDQYAEEYRAGNQGVFANFIDALNRLPRPLMALGTIGLFCYAMADPAGFTARMQGLSFVPEPLWWLLGAIVSFYFGAREMHHFRNKSQVTISVPPLLPTKQDEAAPSLAPQKGNNVSNPAVAEWLSLQG